ncbi:MAG TPA: hypothetical protein VM597_22640 [Gemmataceae bacterium]|jgi:hypothetical protein|nr:hypothetical protein [Gemmataceae bacterium]
MAEITLTGYECERDLLPAVCAKCGAVAGHRVLRKLHSVRHDAPGWTLRYVVRSVAAIGVVCLVIVSLYCVPWLSLRILNRWARVKKVRVPMCEAHRTEWDRLDRLTHFMVSACTVLVPGLWVGGIAFALCDMDVYALFLLPVSLTPYLIFGPEIVFDSWIVRVTHGVPTGSVRLKAVSPAFVAAVVADRAKHRVSDPDRRPTRGGTEDDYDDEPV